MKYNVIDTDPSMLYEPGQEIIGSVDAASPDEAISRVMKAIGVDVLKPFNPKEYAAIVLEHVEAVPALEDGICTACGGDDVLCLNECTRHICADCDHEHVEAVPALEPTGCTCYVAELDAETQFGLRWGAHGLECPRYRRSLDPVDDADDQDYRATHS